MSNDCEASTVTIPDSDKDFAKLTSPKAILWVSTIFGFVALLALMASTVYAISTTDYSGSNYFCDVVNR